ncbi:DUF397 domain-containing protein [Amycolatopsis mongoliensis]|uniref:DUF397 domain-containing protein n=1 Tax=Amycolatopsis mongoliensis TaxID=715475 RepID=A0A9Y2JR27_9PSEU|nr:DUF397 domain-containing protein [Amycolatopsis sp. 4-36]WIY01414.1 DUF397 domain-containing protein [Amycolatopsis sp. 4-36]
MSEWRTSRYSERENCVEVALGPAAKIRDTKDRSGGTLEISTRSWGAFLIIVCASAPQDLREL